MIAQISVEMAWSQLVAEAWCDEDLMKRLLSSPQAVLAEHDLEVPSGTAVDVQLGTEVRVDESDAVWRFILPGHPAHELEEEELDGGPMAYCYSGACGRCGGCGCRCRC
jgi:hypothetical protein